MKLLTVALIVATLIAPGCDKGEQPAATRSGAKPTAEEAAMLARMPGGNIALFGGNYVRFQKHMQDSPLFKLMGALEQQGPGTMEWMNCFIDVKGVAMLSGVKLEGTRVDMRVVLKGIDLATIEGCAKRASFPTQLDADGKFLSLEMPNPLGTLRTGYLAVGDGLLYSRQTMPFPTPTLISVDRAMLEADVAGLTAATSAAGDTVLVSQMGKLDRANAMWFVATGKGTPIADKVGLVHGTMDIERGLTADITAQVLDTAIAKQISEGIPQLKQQAGQLGSAVKTVVDRLQFSRSGDNLRFAISVDNAQLAAVIEQLGPMLPGR